jgi:hypothetical protein
MNGEQDGSASSLEGKKKKKKKKREKVCWKQRNMGMAMEWRCGTVMNNNNAPGSFWQAVRVFSQVGYSWIWK